jgi:hypothetical protein
MTTDFENYKHLMKNKTMCEFLNYHTDAKHTYLNINNEEVCVNMSRTLKRLGLCRTTLSPYKREIATVVEIAVINPGFSKYSTADAVKEVFNQIDNLSIKGYLVGSHLNCFEIIENNDFATMSRHEVIVARPLIVNHGLEYAESLSLYIDNHNLKAIHKLED